MADGNAFDRKPVEPPRAPPKDPKRELPEKPEEPKKPKLKRGIRYVDEGMTVWLPWDRDKGTAIRCKVECAAGNHARVVNTHYKVCKWVRVDDLMIEEGDPHGYS